jgi:hypothetical protein
LGDSTGFVWLSGLFAIGMVASEFWRQTQVVTGEERAAAPWALPFNPPCKPMPPA